MILSYKRKQLKERKEGKKRGREMKRKRRREGERGKGRKFCGYLLVIFLEQDCGQQMKDLRCGNHQAALNTEDVDGGWMGQDRRPWGTREVPGWSCSSQSVWFIGTVMVLLGGCVDRAWGVSQQPPAWRAGSRQTDFGLTDLGVAGHWRGALGRQALKAWQHLHSAVLSGDTEAAAKHVPSSRHTATLLPCSAWANSLRGQFSSRSDPDLSSKFTLFSMTWS